MPQPEQPVVVISHDIVGARMAGPGIRYYQLARVLSQTMPVTLAVPQGSTLESSDTISILVYANGSDPALQASIEAARAVLVPAISVAEIPILLDTHIPIIIDGYNPYVAEGLAFAHGDLPALQARLTPAYLRGDFFMCASERQRDWWLGLLEAHGRLNRWNFQADPSLRQLVDVVAYGHPDESPKQTRAVIKGVWPNIQPDDRLLLWGGGLWSWLDPLTAIRAVAKVHQQRQDVKLVFPGTKHPNPTVPESLTHNIAAHQLAQELGVLNKAVFFGDWVDYADWPNVLLECDIALTLHHDTLETRLAFRSRALEYVWAGLPIIATQGDAISELVDQHNLGCVVDYEDVTGVTEAILSLLDQPRQNSGEAISKLGDLFSWSQAAQPLVRFCQNPKQAADKVAPVEVGNPYYLNQLSALRALVHGYEQGRFMRLMRWVHRLKSGN